jgi:hypothetical protein
MREDETHTRHYMPIMRRILVLAAVVAAVPVVMWTITSFVRDYLGPPRIPTAQTLTAVPVEAAPVQVATAQVDSPPLVADAKAAQLPAPPATNAVDNTLPRKPNSAPPTITITSAVPSADKAPGVSTASPTAALPATTPAPIAANPQPVAANTGKTAMSKPALVAPPINPTPAAAPIVSDRMANDIWPTPPPLPAPTVATAAPAADALPPSGPLAGRVPLPRKRPSSLFIAAQTGVPLPRPRPMDVASAASAEEPAATPFDWFRNLFQPPATTAVQQNFNNAR